VNRSVYDEFAGSIVGTWKATALVVLAGAVLLAWNLHCDYERILANQYRVLEEGGAARFHPDQWRIAPP